MSGLAFTTDKLEEQIETISKIGSIQSTLGDLRTMSINGCGKRCNWMTDGLGICRGLSGGFGHGGQG